MAKLVKCRSCGKEITTTTTKCPGCGGANFHPHVLVALLVGLVFFGLMALVLNDVIWG